MFYVSYRIGLALKVYRKKIGVQSECYNMEGWTSEEKVWRDWL
jgi:hypothetical protein